MEEEDDFHQTEENNNIKIPQEFLKKMDKSCGTCSIAEALSIIEDKDNKDKKNFDYENEIVKMTKEHLDKFNRYGLDIQTTKENSFLLRKYIHDKNIFTSAEQTLLMDLAPGNAEEAFSLIPSLKTKLKSDEMNDILNEINKRIIE